MPTVRLVRAVQPLPSRVWQPLLRPTLVRRVPAANTRSSLSIWQLCDCPLSVLSLVFYRRLRRYPELGLGDVWFGIQRERLCTKDIDQCVLACRMVKNFEFPQRVALNNWAEEKHQIGRSERTTWNTYCIPNNDLGYEEIMNNASRQLKIRRSSAMICKVTTPVNPNGSSRWRPKVRDWFEN